MAKLRVFLTCCWLGVVHAARADGTFSAPAPANCPAPDQLVVLSGDALAPLLGTQLRRLTLLKASPTGLTPIVFQVDRRDTRGRYIIEQSDTAGAGDPVLKLDDELVFRAADSGGRLSDDARLAFPLPLVELRLGEKAGAPPGWVYVKVGGDPQSSSSNPHIEYDQDTDTVASAVYQLVFNKRLPFLVDTFRWRTSDTDGWSPDAIDTMKIRHRGRFLGLIPFQKTEHDYTSRLAAVKIGPLRIIRRTENRIRMLWHLKTPAIYIDYVVMPSGFIMDTAIEIPFNVGRLFRGVDTLTTVDWDDDPALARLAVHRPGGGQALIVDGQMSSEERDFNLVLSNQFTVTSSLGEMLVSLEIPPGVPITPWLYLRDAQDEPDSPENRVGQFGNVGFRTTGWEQIDRQIHHLKLIVCLQAKQ